MKVFLITREGAFHYDYEGRDIATKIMFPQKPPKVLPFKYGNMYNEKDNFLKEFQPSKDGIIMKPSPDSKTTHYVFSEESLKQRLAVDKGESRKMWQALLELDLGQKLYDYVKADSSDCGTYDVLLEGMKAFGYLEEKAK